MANWIVGLGGLHLFLCSFEPFVSFLFLLQSPLFCYSNVNIFLCMVCPFISQWLQAGVCVYWWYKIQIRQIVVILNHPRRSQSQEIWERDLKNIYICIKNIWSMLKMPQIRAEWTDFWNCLILQAIWQTSAFSNLRWCSCISMALLLNKSHRHKKDCIFKNCRKFKQRLELHMFIIILRFRFRPRLIILAKCNWNIIYNIFVVQWQADKFPYCLPRLMSV